MTLVKFNKKTGRPSSPVFSNLFQDLFDNDNFFRPFPERNSLPAVNISENNENYHLELSAAGFSKNEVELTVEDSTLTITGKREERHEESERKFSRKEFSFQNFKRSFSLPENVNQDSIKASFENGILTIELPKKIEEQKQSRKIELV